jgi:predicted dithiol-disulfide oxidoreductase (DUF899 family)
MNAPTSSRHKVVSREEWLVARRNLLAEEKLLTRHQDRISETRRNLPWVRMDKEYLFETADGKVSLRDLFAGRSQLIVKHFMLSAGRDICVGCSFELDHIEGALVHLENHDVSFVAVSRAPLAQIEAARRRMGWKCRWVSSLESDFNYDFHVSFRREDLARGPVVYNYAAQNIPIEDLSGLSVFCRDESGEIFHTYSTFGRGAENVLSTYVLLDITPKGRNETGPRRNLTDWVRPHDRYGAGGHVDATGQFVAAEGCCASDL